MITESLKAIVRNGFFFLLIAFVAGCGAESNSQQAERKSKPKQEKAESRKTEESSSSQEAPEKESPELDEKVRKAKEQFRSLVKEVVVDVGNQRINACRVQLKTLKQGIKAFHLNVGSYPKSLKDLVECPKDMPEKKWRGPFLVELPKDPWGNPFRLMFGEKKDRPMHIVLSSDGPDGKPGTKDDIKEEG